MLFSQIWLVGLFVFFFFCVLYVNHSCFQFLMYKRKYEFVCFHRMKSKKGTEALPLDEEYDCIISLLNYMITYVWMNLML